MKQIITIVGYPRTGTNYLCDLLGKSFPLINSNNELFNKHECFINQKYVEKITELYQKKGKNKIELNKIAGEKPIKFLDTLINISEEQVILYKLFPDHLKLKTVYKILNKSNLLIINKRKFIDVYISNKKALELAKTHNNPWIQVDTTNYKITFDSMEYTKEFVEYEKWYYNIIRYISKYNKKYAFIFYDRFHKLNVGKQQLYIKLILSNIINNKLLDINKNINTLNKQDKSNDYRTKIKNYNDYIAFINRYP